MTYNEAGQLVSRTDSRGVTTTTTVCEVLGIDGSVLRSRRKDRETTRLRELVAAVGIERWGQSAGALGRALGKHPDMISRWARMAAARRAGDPSLRQQHDELDTALALYCSQATIDG